MTQFDNLDGQLSDSMMDMLDYLETHPELKECADRFKYLERAMRHIMEDVGYTPKPEPKKTKAKGYEGLILTFSSDKPNSAAPMHTCKKGGWSEGLRADCSHC